jgi:ribosomal-protein-alanine acetyltransferase
VTREIRPARPGDIDEICAIEGSWAATPHWTRRQFEREIGREGSLFLVMEEGRAPAGYAVAWAVAGEAQIFDIAVSPGLVRRGVGRALLEALLEAARSAGCARATLEVGEANSPARRLYESQGFVVVGRRAKYYNDGSDALLMDKEL